MRYYSNLGGLGASHDDLSLELILHGDKGRKEREKEMNENVITLIIKE